MTPTPDTSKVLEQARDALTKQFLSAMEWGRDYWVSFSMRGSSHREVAEQFADAALALRAARATATGASEPMHGCEEQAQDDILQGLAGAFDQCNTAGMREASVAIQAAAIWIDPKFPIVEADAFPPQIIRLTCEMCDNKRCPHAADEALACTGSNEPGQPGSAYPALASPAAPASGVLSDLLREARDSWGSAGEYADDKRITAFEDWASRVDAALSLEGAPLQAAGAIYVTAHQCDGCGHIGINDEHPTESACNRGQCGWHGPSPKEDRCPECNHEGTMSTACPECGSHYALLTEARIPSRVEGAEPTGAVADLLFKIRGAMVRYGTAVKKDDEDGIRESSTEACALLDQLAERTGAASGAAAPAMGDGEMLDWLEKRASAGDIGLHQCLPSVTNPKYHVSRHGHLYEGNTLREAIRAAMKTEPAMLSASQLPANTDHSDAKGVA